MSDTRVYDAQAGAHMEAEVASQPDAWERAVALRAERAALPARGERIAVVGCGTSWFMAQSYAALRESTGHGVTDAFAASEAFVDRGYVVTAAQYSFLGSGWTVGLAHEGALKMREVSQSWAESYPAKEYRHGPIAIAAHGRVTWMFGKAPVGLAADIAATGAHYGNRPVDAMADLVRAQRVALERARRAGLDPDRPRNLTRSVILESGPRVWSSTLDARWVTHDC